MMRVALVPVRFPNHDEGAGDGSSQQGPVYPASSYATAYDAFGNRTAQYYQTAACSTTYTPTVTYNGNNQVTKAPSSVSGFTYDAAGNVLNDGLNQYAYDGEGRLCAVKNSVSSYTQYVYDASGTRVAKGTQISPTMPLSCPAPTSANLTPSALYLLDQGGDQVTELSGTGTWKHSNAWPGGHLDATYDTLGLHFHIADPLGSRRVQTNAAGVVEEWYESLPFGDGLTPVPNPNCLPANNCYSEDPTENHFTGKERDTESGNDYFEARYYSSSMGRFMSPDWSAKEEPVPYAVLSDPQSLNLYAYVRNNPLVRIDADGHATLVFDAQAHTITLYTNDGQKVGTWHASNNVASNAKFNNGEKTTPLPNGTYGMADKSSPHMHGNQKDSNGDGHPADSPKGEFGKDGIFRLGKSAVNPDGGVGVHSGRDDVPDAAGRTGADHATMGCVRTTGEAMDTITSTAKSDPLTSITVQNSKTPQPPPPPPPDKKPN
jgi:RHS repeat-associated protein